MSRLLRQSARRTRGIALLLVLVVLVLVATLATEIALTARTHAQLADHAMNDFLLRSVIDGRRHILLAALRFDRTLGDNMDTEADPWSWRQSRTLSGWGEAAGTTSDEDTGASEEDGAARRVYRNRDVRILAWCEDERSKINLRGLLKTDDTPAFTHTRDALVRLIDGYREKWPELDVSDSDAQEMVSDLVEWLREKEDTDENPLPAAKAGRGRLLSLDDLLRVPGGRWRTELLHDVRDPEETEEGDFSRRTSGPAPEDTGTDDDGSDSAWERQNGVPGLLRYLTVWAESAADPALRINVNTAPRAVLEALFDPGQEDFVAAILRHRRAGGEPGAPGSGETPSSDEGQGWLKTKNDLTKVEGLGDDLARYPRLNFFADVSSSVFSLRIIATVVQGQREGEDDDAPTDLVAAYQYREVVQRTQQGFVSLHAERRQDPLLGELGE